jgi:hypothetical protein
MESTNPAAIPVKNRRGQPQVGISSILHFCRESALRIKWFRGEPGFKPTPRHKRTNYPHWLVEMRASPDLAFIGA